MSRLNSKLQFVRNTFQVHHGGDPGSVLNYGTVEKGAVSIITIAGTIDATAAPELHVLLNGHISRKQNIIIYMSDVLYFDTAGAATMLEAYAAARDNALDFVLAAASQNVRQTINMCGLNQVLPMCERIEDAEQHIQRHQGTQ